MWSKSLKKRLKKGIEVMDSFMVDLINCLRANDFHTMPGDRPLSIIHQLRTTMCGNEAPRRSTSAEAQADVLTWWGSSTRLFSGRHQDAKRQRRSQLLQRTPWVAARVVLSRLWQM